MKTTKILFLEVILIFIFIPISSAQVKAIPDSVSKFAKCIEIEMEKIDKNCSKKNMLGLQIPYLGRPSKKIRVEVNVNDSILRRLVFESFDESFTSQAKEIYYFDSVGKLISHANNVTGEMMHEIFYNPNVVIYSFNKKSISNVTLLKDFEADYVLANTKFILDYYLSNFSAVKYSTYDISKTEAVILKTTSKTSLRKNPNVKSEVIKDLPKGSELQYIDRSVQRDSLIFGKEKWIWLKIRDKSKQTGWIWGHPSIVAEN